MTRVADRPLQVVVCGAIFGQVYLEAFRSATAPATLAGVVARGSARAQACARHYGVPLFTSIDALPDTVDAACVVVRSRILGGKGTELAHAFLRRGIHVLQEHPVHCDEIGESLRLARAKGLQFRVNPFYANLAPVRRFVGAVRALAAGQRPLYVDASCGCQLSFSLLDIVARLLGSIRPWTVHGLAARPGEPFSTVTATLAGVPVTIRIQNELDPSDPDGYSYFLHRVAVGFVEGSLVLVDTHGPVVWIPRPQFPRDVRLNEASPQFANPWPQTPRLQVIGSPDTPSFEEMFRSQWPAGVRRALIDLGRAIHDGADPLRVGSQQLAVAELWRDALTAIGPPRLVHAEPMGALSTDQLAAMHRSAHDWEQMP